MAEGKDHSKSTKKLFELPNPLFTAKIMLNQLKFQVRHLRLNLFKALLRPFSYYSRKKRNVLFTMIMDLKAGMKILDVGGHPQIWDTIGIPLKITCLNMVFVADNSYKTHHEIEYVEGDGCFMPQYRAGDFDLVFSNSVIEHVGNSQKRKQFANEIRRICKNYWIQTPSKYFPIEAHCGMPYWWFYPEKIRSFFLDRWYKKVPAWTDMVATTTVVSEKEIKELFLECQITKEWLIFPKSLIAYSHNH